MNFRQALCLVVVVGVFVLLFRALPYVMGDKDLPDFTNLIDESSSEFGTDLVPPLQPARQTRKNEEESVQRPERPTKASAKRVFRHKPEAAHLENYLSALDLLIEQIHKNQSYIRRAKRWSVMSGFSAFDKSDREYRTGIAVNLGSGQTKTLFVTFQTVSLTLRWITCVRLLASPRPPQGDSKFLPLLATVLNEQLAAADAPQVSSYGTDDPKTVRYEMLDTSEIERTMKAENWNTEGRLFVLAMQGKGQLASTFGSKSTWFNGTPEHRLSQTAELILRTAEHWEHFREPLNPYYVDGRKEIFIEWTPSLVVQVAAYFCAHPQFEDWGETNILPGKRQGHLTWLERTLDTLMQFAITDWMPASTKYDMNSRIAYGYPDRAIDIELKNMREDWYEICFQIGKEVEGRRAKVPPPPQFGIRLPRLPGVQAMVEFFLSLDKGQR